MSSYVGLEALTVEVDMATITHVNVVGYKIKEGTNPFMTFLLCKNQENKMNVPVIILDENTPRPNLPTTVCNELIQLLENQNYNELSCKDILFKGFYIHLGEVFMFYDLSNAQWDTYDFLLDKKYLWFGLIDEIINKQTICNNIVDPALSKFFLDTPSFCLLEDNNKNPLEVPIVAYIHKPLSGLNFTFVFGASKGDVTGLFGPYYYFTSYLTAIKDGGWGGNKDPNNHVNTNTDIVNNKGGIVRFAVFLKNTLVSETLDGTHDGWDTQYESLFIILNDTPIIVAKDYEQQCPLSFHFIDRKNPTVQGDYSIM